MAGAEPLTAPPPAPLPGASPGILVDGAGTVSVVAVLVLVLEVASEVHLSTSYLAVTGALAGLIVVSALVGRAVGSLLPAAPRRSVILHLSMRDFAIASGIATAAFGAGSTGPLGIYGILVLLWGSAAAWIARHRGLSAS